MPRLPQPGSDYNTWGDILNQYLLTGHRSDGTHDVKALLGVPDNPGYIPVTNNTTNGFTWQSLSGSHTHAQYLHPAEVLAGTNVTVDTTTTPGSVIINATGSSGAVDSVNGDTGAVMVPTFRGAWVANIPVDQVLATYDFASGTIPAGFSASDPNVSVVSYASPVGGAITPTAPVNMVRLDGASVDDAVRILSLNLASLSLPTLSKVRFWHATDTEDGYDFTNFVDDGGNVVALSRTGITQWEQVTADISSPTNVIDWEYRKDEVYTDGSDSYYVARIELLETIQTGPSLYRLGDTVTHLDKIWRCATAATLATPGANGEWVEILDATSTGGSSQDANAKLSVSSASSAPTLSNVFSTVPYDTVEDTLWDFTEFNYTLNGFATLTDGSYFINCCLVVKGYAPGEIELEILANGSAIAYASAMVLQTYDTSITCSVLHADSESGTVYTVRARTTVPGGVDIRTGGDRSLLSGTWVGKAHNFVAQPT